MKRKVIHKRLFKQETHSISVHPQLWKWAEERAAEEKYNGGVSAYLSGLVLFDRALRRKHFLTAQVMNEPGELEKVMTEIEQHDPMKESGTWIEHRLRELISPRTPNP